MLSRPRTLPTGFIQPCLPTKAPRPPSGALWLHEIKHDGFRVIARKEGERVKLYSRPGNDLTGRFPLIVEALARLRSRSCIIDGEAVACDESGIAQFDRIRHRSHRRQRVPLRLRPDRAERRRPAPRSAAGPQGHARVNAGQGWSPAFASTSISNATTARSSSVTLASSGSKASCRSVRTRPTAPAAHPTGSR